MAGTLRAVGLLSVRITSAERVKLKAGAQAQGFRSLSEYVRMKCGLNPAAINDQADVVPPTEVVDLEHLLPLTVAVSDAVRLCSIDLERICQHLGIRRMKEYAPKDGGKHADPVKDDGFSRG